MTTFAAEIGRSIADKVDFKLFMMEWHFEHGALPLDCKVCSRRYKKQGWIRRHLRKTGHWRQYPEAQ